ncbi:MAG: CRTAC1 family protein [Saprospiraceae bacterium]|nr:CRTAC1 family protein [Saprospiraceae bacterium]
MRLICIGFACVLILSCSEEPRITNADTTAYQLFESVPADASGVTFENTITETKYLNPLVYDTYINGAGVAMLDVNNDGLQDLYFAGNLVHDRLYLNKGDFEFEDITVRAGIERDEHWSTGVTVADVNGDGWDDIYVCKYLYDDAARRVNVLYENQQNGTFREKAAEYGLADAGYGIVANFFDYDGDNDLDLYVGNQPPSSLYERPKLKGKIDYRFSDRLYRNDGGRFTDVTAAAGITNYTYTLSVITSDLNNDGLVDIYVACDYEEPDIMYINNGDGTFRNEADAALRHMSNFSMGADVADINNDGWMDIFTADMVAEDHYRLKTNMSGMNPEKFWSLANNGYHYQYMFNALQLNNGNGTFSEIAQLAGVSHTDWSWAAFFMDADHDGYKDLVVTNGQAKEMRNKDYEMARKEILESANTQEDMHDLLFEIAQMAPQQKLVNYLFRNNGDLTFTNLAAQWGLDAETWSQGACIGDLDNDGDLDLVINNINDPALIYRNMVNDLKINNYLSIEVDGPAGNLAGLHAKAEVVCAGMTQVAELSPVRGYMSTMQDLLHFGLGDCAVVDRVRVTWPDGKVWEATGVKANQKLTARYADAVPAATTASTEPLLFTAVDPGQIRHVENQYDDYAREILLPYQMSTLGPVVATGDVNGDGTDDLYLGGSAGHPGSLFSYEGARLVKINNPVFELDATYEDGGAVFIDIDGDDDLDLYVSSGGNEFDQGSSLYQDRLYLNNGQGVFQKSTGVPNIKQSGSVVVPLDFDGDNDMDLFVGGRQVPGHYGFVPQSYLLENMDGKFVDRSDQLPRSGELGMVTDTDWRDIDGSGDNELIITGEWMPIMICRWSGDAFADVTPQSLQTTRGLWNRLVLNDIDLDGDLDIIAGNLGTNMKYDATPEAPFKLYADDFDGNGTHDVYLGYYAEDGQCYPVRGRSCSSDQMPFVKEKFKSYAEFASATIDEVLAGRVSEQSHQQQAEMFESGIFYQDGKGAFSFMPFPNAVQVAPIYGIVVHDLNGDNVKDLLLAGNYYNREVETTRSDAGVGSILLGNDSGGFDYVHPAKTGVIANGDVRNVVALSGGGRELIVVANNNAPFQFYQLASK